MGGAMISDGDDLQRAIDDWIDRLELTIPLEWSYIDLDILRGIGWNGQCTKSEGNNDVG